MQDIFVRHFQQSDVEFNRLLFPLRYKVLLRVPNANPVILHFDKDEGEWDAQETDKTAVQGPLLSFICDVIKENEATPAVT